MDCRIDGSPAGLEDPGKLVEREGGLVVGSCRDPLGGDPIMLAVLPTDSVEPAPFQRDLSEAHHKKLANVIKKTGMFLDPVIVVPAPDGGFWTPDRRHRL
jgi:ParB family chromosome partitioning protein